MSDAAAHLLTMRGITKRFPGVVALKDVSLELRAGEVLALMGENGAGKSTLMKILGGAYPPDEGELLIDGQPVVLKGIADAKKRGIALIHQELMLVPQLSIADNIFLGNERRQWGILNRLDRAEMNRQATALLARVGLRLPPTMLVSELTAGQMQMVEISKALALNARLIIMDEPTSSLTLGESRQLFEIIRALRQEGIGIIYISHWVEACRWRENDLRRGGRRMRFAKASISRRRIARSTGSFCRWRWWRIFPCRTLAIIAREGFWIAALSSGWRWRRWRE